MMILADENDGRDTTRQRKKPSLAPQRQALKAVSLNKATAARITAAKKKQKEIEVRAQELRDTLCGGGWCANGGQPSWLAHDQKVHAKLMKGKSVPSIREGKNESSSSSEEDEEDEAAEEAKSLAVALLDRWTEELLKPDHRILVDAAAIATLRKGLASTIAAVKKPPSLAETRLALQAAMARLLNGDAKAEIDVDKLDLAIRSHPDYVREQQEKRNAFDAANEDANSTALAQVRRCVPPNPSAWSLAELEAALPLKTARRVFRKRALHLVRMPKPRIAKLHIVELRGAYETSGLDVIEARAVFASLPESWDNDSNKEKQQWADDLREVLVNLVQKNSEESELYTVDVFSPDDIVETDVVTVRSGINDGAADRANELAALRAQNLASKKQCTPNLKKKLRLSTTKKKNVVVKVNLLNSKRKTSFAAPDNALMDQLKNALKARGPPVLSD